MYNSNWKQEIKELSKKKKKKEIKEPKHLNLCNHIPNSILCQINNRDGLLIPLLWVEHSQGEVGVHPRQFLQS